MSDHHLARTNSTSSSHSTSSGARCISPALLVMGGGGGSSSSRSTNVRTPKRQRAESNGCDDDTLKAAIADVPTSRSVTVASSYLNCPICLNLFEEPYITRCGHTFCYTCITQSLQCKESCPTCSAFCPVETGNRNGGDVGDIQVHESIIPNFMLNEIVKRHRISQRTNSRELLANESQKLSLGDVNDMLDILTQRKQLLETESCAAQNRLLLDFLRQLLIQKRELQIRTAKELNIIERDIAKVEQLLSECLLSTPSTHSEVDSVRKQRLEQHFDDFVECYLNARSKDVFFASSDESGDQTADRELDDAALDQFKDNLTKYSRYTHLKVVARLNYSNDLFNNSTIVSSIEFDKDREFLAIAGVTKKLKIFNFNAIIEDRVDIYSPCIELLCKAKISCVSWNAYHKSTLGSSDYEGTVTIWDAATGQRTKTYQEHEKRCWCVDFNEVDTRLIASGSDDARVKLYSLNGEHSVATLEAKANVCCVKFNPRSSCHLAFGSADHCVHYYDLRNMKEALSTFKGHKKAVSYVKFLNNEDLVSASTDSQLKLWNVNKPYCLRSFTGHLNEKNFIGLATDGDYIACGSENNAMFIYYKGLSKRLFSYNFGSLKGVLEQRREDDVNEFVSAVCWKQMSNIVVAANSEGIINVFELV